MGSVNSVAWDDPANDAAKQAQAQDAQSYVKELEQKYGIGAGSTDVENLAGKNPTGFSEGATDYNDFKAALDKQFDERAHNIPQGRGAVDETTQSWGGGGSGGGSSNGYSGPGVWQPSWYSSYLDSFLGRQTADLAQNQGRDTALWGTLNDRVHQSLQIDPNDPNIRQQADAFSANQNRSARNHLADMAESGGPTANMLGEQRLTAERVGQNTGSFEASLVGKELQSRRDEIQAALTQQGAMLSQAQQAQLQRELATLNHAIAQQNLAVTSQLGNRGLDIEWQKALLGDSEFMQRLGLDSSTTASEIDLRRRGL